MNVITPAQIAAQNFTSVYKSDVFYRRAAKEIGFDGGGALKELRVFENRIRSLRDQENLLTNEAAYHAFIEHQAKATDLAENPEEFARLEHWTREDWVQDYAQRRQALTQAIRKISTEAYPLARKVTLKFCDAVDSYGKDIRAAEEKESKRFGVVYQPSSLTVALTEAGPFLRRTVADERPSQYTETPPSRICPFLDL